MVPSSAELTYFSEICNFLNISKAAQKLGISQPSLTLAIKRLEQTVGTELFTRHKQGVALTHAGRELLVHVKQLLQYWESTKSKALASHQEIQGNFTIGCHPVIANYINGFILELFENYPKLYIHFQHDISRNITKNVINSNIDIGIASHPIRHPNLIIRKIYNYDFTLLVGPGKRNIQNMNSEESILLCDPELLQTQKILAKLNKSKKIISINSLEVIANLTAKGCGIGILPTCFSLSTYPEIKPIANAPIYSDEVFLIYRNESRDVKAIQIIIDSIKKFIKATIAK